jgi:hypothetical protein
MVGVNTAVAEDDWTFIIAPYALVPTISGDSSVGRVEGAEIDVGPQDILNNLKLGGMIQGEAHHKSGYGVSLAYNFMDLEDNASNPSGTTTLGAEIFQGIFEGYGVYRYQTSRGPLDIYGGVRWWSMDVDLKLNGAKISSNDADWVDPVVGLRWIPTITKNWRLILKGDIGGFGAGSDFTWNLQGGFAWDATDYMVLVFQYRAMSVDYSDGAVGSTDRFAYDTITHGPILGLSFRF